MHILYDHQIFSMQKFGGISTYFFNLYKYMSRQNDLSANLSIRYTDNELISGEPSTGSAGLFKKNFRGKYRVQNYLNRKRSVEFLKKGEFDVFHPTYFDRYFLPYLKKKPFVLTVFDMAVEKRLTKTAQKKVVSGKRELAEKASAVIAISESSKKDIMELFSMESSRIKVIPLAGDHILTDQNFIHPVLNKRYMLFVGKRESYKNFELFLKSTVRVLNEQKDLLLVCTGGGDFSTSEIKMIEELGIKDKVLLLKADNVFLHHLYENAECFVFPSLYEGFGIPVIEAFLSGCPVLLSDIGVFREIAGAAALYFDPGSPGSIHQAIGKLLNNRSLANDLRSKGLEKGRSYSWERTASLTREIYNALI